MPLPAFAHNQSGMLATRRLTIDGKEHIYISYLSFWPSFSSGTGYPSTAIPVGYTDEGLPVGMQIMGLSMKDLITIDVAEKIAEVLGGFQAPPGYETQQRDPSAAKKWEAY